MPMTKPVTLLSWAGYDFANTIFSAVVMTAYFPLYLTEISGSNWYLGMATTLSMLLAGLVIPFMGALSDQTGRTKRYLFRTTLLSILFLIPLYFFRQPFVLILCFAIACFFFHASLVFYNSLLPVVATPETQGFASGLGTGLGYLGVVLSLPVAHLVDQHLGRPAVFLLAGIFFLVFSLPLFLWVPERKVDKALNFRWGLWVQEWKKIGATLKQLPKRPPLLLFLAGNFLVVDALNSAIFWLSVYMREVFHPPQSMLIGALIAINSAAFIFGILSGILTDRLGALKSLVLACLSLAISLAILAVVQDFKVFVAVSTLGGAFAISGIWTAGRKVLLELTQGEKVGEYFGLYGLTTKVSIAGSLAFSLIADRWGFRQALGAMVCPAILGCFLIASSLRAISANQSR